MKKFLVAILAVSAIATTAVATTFTVNADSDKYSDDQLALIQQHCSTVRITLQQLQVADSNTRSYLSGIYLNATNNFLTPLNVRLVRNNITAPNLVDSQAEFVAARDQFSAAYLTYARSLDALLKTDCYNNPEQFMDQLAITRHDRSSVEYHVNRLSSLLSQHKQEVRTLKESL